MFASGNRLLFLSSLMAWSTACIVDSFIIEGINVAVLGLYVVQLLLWVMALSDTIAPNLRRVVIALGMLLALFLSLIPNVILAPVMLCLWVSIIPFSLSRRQSWVTYVIYNAIFLLGTMYVQAEQLITAASFVAFQLFSLSSSFLRIELTEKTDALEQANAKLHTAQALLEQRSKAEERVRISQDLHDNIGQRLTALSLHCEFALHKPPTDAQIFLRSLKSDISETLEQLRDVVAQLKPRESLDLVAALYEIAGKIPSLTIDIDLKARFNDATINEQLLLCLQEGINNALRHGKATHITITEIVSDEWLLLSLEDNGRHRGSITNENGGTGIKGMQRRLVPFDADVDLDLLVDKAVLNFRIPECYLCSQ
jgi:signal transduction histidine kinase